MTGLLLAANNTKILKSASAIEVGSRQQNSLLKITYKKLQVNKSEGLKLNTAKIEANKIIQNHPKNMFNYKLNNPKYNACKITLLHIKTGVNKACVK